MTRTVEPARIMAAGLALGGLITMMVAPAPSWVSVKIGLSCLLMFCVLWIVPLAKPMRRLAKRRRRIYYEILEAPIELGQPRRVREILPSQRLEFSGAQARRHGWRGTRILASRQPPWITSGRPS